MDPGEKCARMSAMADIPTSGVFGACMEIGNLQDNLDLDAW